ncbi:mediator complex subunit MED14 [Xylariaceae sp. FL0594]|nr:mediator complex subunit MED14 [Xylariaceae sp. FL0594]
MNDLPDEIQHITQGFIPLSLLLSRLAQQTHNELTDEIMALAKMPTPQSAMNGNVTNGEVSMDDNSPESLNKKVRLLKFIQEKHGEWIKALVICHWSRRAQDVSKLIDLMHHINMTRSIYQTSLDYMINIKRDLTFARLPNPDLNTALEVLATGQAPWMPDLNYIQPPPLTAEEQMEWIENLNTLLSIRLNLEEHENIPEQFQDFHIGSGRVTFKVPSEFEVDLTIADEDPTSQFWFLDFRFAFQPAPAELPENLRMMLEFKVNEALKMDGLVGCYKYLHEFVLTQKITEYLRQATELSKGRWTGMLQVERLRRAMAIHYWSSRQPREAPQSYIIICVSSGKALISRPDQKPISHLSLRWFRDGVEVKDTKFPLGDEEIISTEALLEKVIGKHVEHILTGFHTALKSHGRFVRDEASLGLNIVADRPEQCALAVQLSREHFLTMKVAPITGAYLIQPPVRGNFDLEYLLNKDYRRPVNEQVTLIEKFRCHLVEDDLGRRGRNRGWRIRTPPVKYEETKTALGIRAAYVPTWLERRGLPENWYIMLGQSPGGDQWWLIQVIQGPEKGRIATNTPIPLTSGMPRYSDQFFAELTFISAAMISQLAILDSLHKEKIKYNARGSLNPVIPNTMKVPSIHVRLSDVLSRQYPHEVSKKMASWAVDFVEISLRAIEIRAPESASSDVQAEPEPARGDKEPPARPFVAVVDARVKVADPARFGPLKGNVGRDVAFNERLGVFTFTIETKVGNPMLATLAHRLQALSRLASSIDAIRQNSRDVRCEEITLSNIKFSYADGTRAQGDEPGQGADRWTASLELKPDSMALVLGPSNPQMRACDHFNKLINSEQGFRTVPWYLSMTLPVHRALDSIAAAWRAPSTMDHGRVIISAVALDWCTVEYVLGSAKSAGRRLTLHARIRSHHDQAEWHIYREEAAGSKEAGSSQNPDDEFQQILQKVWSSDIRTWRRLRNGVAAPTSTGAENLLKFIDDAIRPLAMKSPILLKQPPARAAGPRNAGNNRNMAPTAAANRNRAQSLSQSTPQPQSQSQPQSQPPPQLQQPQQSQQQTGPVFISLDD